MATRSASRSVSFSMAVWFRSAAAGALSVALCAPGSAQGDPEPVDPYGIPGSEGKTFGRTIPGHFNDDQVLDVAILANGEVTVLSGRDLYLSHETPWTGVLDLDTYPGGGPNGQDAVVFTKAAGLYVGWWDFATTAFTSTLVDGSAWAGATCVRAAEVDGVSRVDVAGISADGHSLLVLGAVDDTPVVFAPIANAGFTLPQTIRSFTTLQWDGTGMAEWAMLTSTALEIRSLTGALVQQWPTGASGGWITSLHHDYQAKDRLVWITVELPAGQSIAQWIFTFDKDHVDPPKSVAGLHVTSLVSGDWDEDGDDDIALSHQYRQQIYVVNNERTPALPAAVSFPTSGNVWSFGMGEPATPNPGHVANPVLGDFDHDGDLDAGMAVQATKEFRIARNAATHDEALEPVVLDMHYIVTLNATEGELVIDFDRDPSFAYPVTHLQVKLWRQRVLGEPTSSGPVAVEAYPIAQWPDAVTVLVPESGHYFLPVYYLEMRFVVLDAFGAVLRSYPASVGGFTLSPISYEVLFQVEDVGEELMVIPEGDLVFQPGDTGVLSGAYVPNMTVPPATGMNNNNPTNP